MIFSGTWRAVLSGQKTQTRRLKRGIRQVGQTYAIQSARGGGSLGRIRILRIWQQRIIDVSEEEAKAEGFGSVEEWFSVLCDVYPVWHRERGMHPMDMVWAFEFEVVGSAR